MSVAKKSRVEFTMKLQAQLDALAAQMAAMQGGITAPAGPKGDTGPAGATGAKGDTGNTGTAGAQGIQGATGPAGGTGATGPAGAAGTVNAKGVTYTHPTNVVLGAFSATINFTSAFPDNAYACIVTNLTPSLVTLGTTVTKAAGSVTVAGTVILGGGKPVIEVIAVRGS